MKPSAAYPQPARIETPRLILRPMREEDAALIVAWRNRPEDAISYQSVEPLTVEKHLKWFHGPRLGRVDYMIEQRHDARCIGTIHFKNIELLHRRAESGRLIGDPSCRGLGYGKESALAWFRYGYEELGLREVRGITHSTNAANIALNKTLGYRLDQSSVSQDFCVMVLNLEEARISGLLDLPSVPPQS